MTTVHNFINHGIFDICVFIYVVIIHIILFLFFVVRE